jgi:hypothetical protein
MTHELDFRMEEIAMMLRNECISLWGMTQAISIGLKDGGGAHSKFDPD